MEQLASLPTPDHITLLLKRHKSTVALSVLPNSSFSQVKATLLAVLKSRNLMTLPGTEITLPDTADDIELGILKDKKDPSRGWISLDTKAADLSEPKSGKRKASSKLGIQLDTPADAGLVDGSLIAYRLRSGHPKHEDEDGMMDTVDDPGWDVLLPIYEDDMDEEI